MGCTRILRCMLSSAQHFFRRLAVFRILSAIPAFDPSKYKTYCWAATASHSVQFLGLLERQETHPPGPIYSRYGSHYSVARVTPLSVQNPVPTLFFQDFALGLASSSFVICRAMIPFNMAAFFDWRPRFPSIGVWRTGGFLNPASHL